MFICNVYVFLAEKCMPATKKKKLLIHHFLYYITYTLLYLASSMLCINISGHWKSRVKNFLGVIYWSLKQMMKVFIFRHILVTWFPPLSYGLGRGGGSLKLIHQSFLENKQGSSENVPLLASISSLITFCLRVYKVIFLKASINIGSNKVCK